MSKYYYVNSSSKCRKCPYASYRDNKIIFCGACWKDILNGSKKPVRVKKE